MPANLADRRKLLDGRFTLRVHRQLVELEREWDEIVKRGVVMRDGLAR